MKLLSKFALLSALVLAPTTLARAQTAPPAQTPKAPAPVVRDVFNGLMTALQNDDYAAFTAAADADFKAASTKKSFEAVVAQIAPRQKNGYEAIYLEQLRRGAYATHLWKLSFQDGGDDILAEMSLKDGKIGGFFLR